MTNADRDRPDTVFARAAGGEYDAVVALYHDQGHIAVKMLGLDTGVNVTIGLRSFEAPSITARPSILRDGESLERPA